VTDEDRTVIMQRTVFSSDTVLIVAAGLAFVLAMLGWLAGHRISLALPPDVTTRAMVPLMIGATGMFIGAGLGLLLGELKRVEKPADGTHGVDTRTVKQRVGGLRTVSAAQVVLAVGVILLLATVWMIKP
jgi:hypothetical protein